MAGEGQQGQQQRQASSGTFRRGFQVQNLGQARTLGEQIEQAKQKAIQNMIDKQTKQVKEAFPERVTGAFLPTDYNNQVMMEIQSRQAFLDEAFDRYFSQQKFIVFGVLSAILAIATFKISPFIAAFFALLAGIYYMKYNHFIFMINAIYRRRSLLQTV